MRDERVGKRGSNREIYTGPITKPPCDLRPVFKNDTTKILVFNLQQDYKLRALITIGYPTNVQKPQLGIPHPKTTLKDTPSSIN